MAGRSYGNQTEREIFSKGSAFFFEKKKQKTFVRWWPGGLGGPSAFFRRPALNGAARHPI
jgi:hypothetical protein